MAIGHKDSNFFDRKQHFLSFSVKKNTNRLLPFRKKVKETLRVCKVLCNFALEYEVCSDDKLPLYHRTILQ